MVALGLAVPHGAPAQDAPPGAKQSGQQKEDIDSEHIFGVTEGSDIGEAGEKEAEVEPFGRFGKRSGTYAATSTEVMVKYTPVDTFRFAPVVAFASHNISNVPGLPNTDQFRFEGIGVELRYRLLDREKAPFGLTLSALPAFNHVDETSGLPVGQFGVEFLALMDKELVPDRVFAAINLLYEPEWTREPTGEREREATAGVSGALSLHVAPGVFVAAEARYLRKYQGVTLNAFLGEALFVGPSLYMKFPNQWFASVAWNAQVAGHAVGDPAPLDLTNFERHNVRLRFGLNF